MKRRGRFSVSAPRGSGSLDEKSPPFRYFVKSLNPPLGRFFCTSKSGAIIGRQNSPTASRSLDPHLSNLPRQAFTAPQQQVNRTPQPHQRGYRTPSVPDASSFFRFRRSLVYPYPPGQSEGCPFGRRIFTATQGSGKDPESDQPLIHEKFRNITFL